MCGIYGQISTIMHHNPLACYDMYHTRERICKEIIEVIDPADPISLCNRYHRRRWMEASFQAITKPLVRGVWVRTDVPRMDDHGNAVAGSLHGPATTGTAVTYSVKASQHCIFEIGMMPVPALMFGFEDRHHFFRGNGSSPFGMMLGHETGKGFADNKTYIHR